MEENVPQVPPVPPAPPVVVKKYSSVLVLIMALVIILSLGSTVFFAYQNMKLTKQIAELQKIRVSPTPTQVPVAYFSPNPSVIASPTVMASPTIPGWKIYTSGLQKISFQYPPSWTVINSPQWAQGQAPGIDHLSLQSSDGIITITWLSEISGLGGGCDANAPLGSSPAPNSPNPCPLFTLVDKTPIIGASGLYVVSGTITGNGINYAPFIAVQDNRNGELLATQRTMGYDEFSRDSGNTDAIFSTGGIYASGPSLSQTDANAWFSKPSVQQAKQILSSLQFTQ